MQFVIHQKMDIIAVMLLFLFGIYAIRVLDKKVAINKLYLSAISLNTTLIIFEATSNILTEIGKGLFWARFLSGLIFVLTPVLAYLYLQFVCFYFSNKFKISKKVNKYFLLLLVINAFAAIFVSRTKDFLQQGAASYILPFIVSLVFLIYSVYVIKMGKKSLLKYEYSNILHLSLITNGFVVAQFFISDTKFLLCSCIFTLVIMFFVLQQRELCSDYLTGARNRQVLKKCLDSYSFKSSGSLSLVMIDLDYFKKINDSFGHLEGDTALRTFVKIMQKVFAENGIIIRMGGDEFVILIYNLSGSKIEALLNKMALLVERYNTKSSKPYKLEYSYACGKYQKGMEMEQFMHEIDLKMYDNKNKRKSQCLG